MSSSHPSSTPEPSIVMVPVPVHRLTEVYELLGRPPADEADGDGGSSVSAWSTDDLARLHQMLGPDSAARAFLDHCSAQPEQSVWYGTVCDALGRSHNSVRSEMAGFTRRLKSRFGRDDWPFRAEWVDGRALYTIDTETARAWLRVSGQDPEAAT